ncbi:C/H/G cyclin, partial [Thelephora ganbajun]
MAADFWSSSHYKRWIVDRATLRQARAEDMRYVKDPLFFDLFNIFTGNLIARICKRMAFRQRVTATASVFFRRFYLKNSYCETDPFIVIAACCYIAAKAEEFPVHIKTVVNESRSVFSRLGVKNFPTDNSKLAEMEFYLVGDLECDLVVFHPYRTLISICGKEGGKGPDQEAGELGFGVNDGPRYWGTGEGKLILQESAFQNVWLIINDLYRTDLCLMYPPHLIAIGALMVTLAYHTSTKPIIQQAHNERTSGNSHKSQSSPQPRRSGRTGHIEKEKDKKPPQDVIGFLAGLNVSMSAVGTVVQEILSFYTLWDLFADE